MQRSDIIRNRVIESVETGFRYLVTNADPCDGFFELTLVEPHLPVLYTDERANEFRFVSCGECAAEDLIVIPWVSLTPKQSYHVYVCRTCGDYWSCRHQWDAGTGEDNRWKRWGPDPQTITRHY